MSMLMRCLLGAATAAVAAACGRAGANEAASASGTRYIVGIDVSGSRTASGRREARTLLDQLIDRRITNGDQLVLVEMYGADDGKLRQWSDSVPALRDARKRSPLDDDQLADFRSGAHDIVAAFFDSTRRVANTDVFATLFRAADYAGAQRRPTVVLLLSDMENSTSEVNMEREDGVPSRAWIKERKQQGRLPDLAGVCVAVAGASSESRRAARIRDFWVEYLTAAGARLPAPNYRDLMPDPGEVSC